MSATHKNFWLVLRIFLAIFIFNSMQGCNSASSLIALSRNCQQDNPVIYVSGKPGDQIDIPSCPATPTSSCSPDLYNSFAENLGNGAIAK